MYDLLDYIVKNYQNGGYINPFNPSESPTQSGVLSSSGIDLTDDKYKAFIPTYDQTGEDFLRTNYTQKREGSYSTARDTLGQLGQESRETKAQQGFAGSGKSLLDTTREDIVDQFSMDADSMYTGLQQDITSMRRDYKEDVLASIGDLPQDAYTIGGRDFVPFDNPDWNPPTTRNEGDSYHFDGETYYWDGNTWITQYVRDVSEQSAGGGGLGDDYSGMS